jgi:hypothetical protein
MPYKQYLGLKSYLYGIDFIAHLMLSIRICNILKVNMMEWKNYGLF